MTEKDLKELIRKYDKEAVLKKDSYNEFRIFLFSNFKRYPIANAIDKKEDWKITRISDYEQIDKTKPRVVISLKRLRLKKERKKPKGNDKSSNTTASIK